MPAFFPSSPNSKYPAGNSTKEPSSDNPIGCMTKTTLPSSVIGTTTLALFLSIYSLVYTFPSG